MSKIRIIGRWKLPYKHSAYDVIHFGDDTYAWARTNTNVLVSTRVEYKDLPKLEPDIWNLVYNKIMPDLYGSEASMTGTTRAVDKNEPKNNDGLDRCYRCSELTRIAGGGAYQVCNNKDCSWYSN